MKLSVILVLFNLFFSSPQHIHLPHFGKEIVLKEVMKNIPEKTGREKVRWKRIFRPVKIFDKKWIFWLLIFGGIVLSMTLLVYFLDKGEGIETSDAVAYSLVGIYLLSLLFVALLLLSIPIILVVRFVRALRWRRRFSRCS